jgi:group II intron reverse transcriptase/maturase
VIAHKAQNTPLDPVRVLQRKLYRAAKEAPRRTFGILYDKVYRPDGLAEAWRRVRRNRGSAGVDKQTIAAVEAYGVDRLLNELRTELREKRYRPLPVHRVYIPKLGKPGQRRGVGIPAVRDRMVQAAVQLVIEPILDADFRDCSYGFRPKRGAPDAISEVQAQITWGYRKVIDADLQACCASLPHAGVLAAVARRIRDPWLRRLLRRWLRAGILEEGTVRTAVAGTPEGGGLSPVLANAYMHAFDEVWESKMRGTRLIRYCDDYVILCRGNPQPWFQRIEGLLTGLGLTLNVDKTRIVDAAEGFDFLGMHFRLQPRRSNPKRLFCYRWPSTRAMHSIRVKIRDAIGYADLYSLEEKMRAINPLLRGWGQYFRHGNAHRHFKKIDSYVYTKLVNFLRRTHKRRGKGFRAFPPAFFKKAGLYQLHGTIVHMFRTPRGERGRKAGGGKSSCPV